MRNLVYGVAALALAMTFGPDTVRSALAASASALFEATPFLLAGLLAARLLRRRAGIVEHLGCGCGRGASARSLPAMAATWLVFGPAVAVARYAAAVIAARVIGRRSSGHAAPAQEPPDLLAELGAVLPAAALAGPAMQLGAIVDPARLGPIGAALLGAALGFVAAPCGIGAVALAGALRVHAPYAAAAFLCVAGIVDLRTLIATRHRAAGHDAFAYVLLFLALGVVALRRGDTLLNPAFTVAIAGCACGAAACAAWYRHRRSPAARVAPALMLAGAIAGAPPPSYHATETTLTDRFAGERLTFTGALAREDGRSAVVRYAITCCRADAAPVAVRLARVPPYPAGTWLRVDGRLESFGNDLRLVAQSIRRVAAPGDPFIYR